MRMRNEMILQFYKTPKGRHRISYLDLPYTINNFRCYNSKVIGDKGFDHVIDVFAETVLMYVSKFSSFQFSKKDKFNKKMN